MDILFSTETEDRAVSFSLDVVTKTVSEIQINGNTDFPYTPSLDGFIIWVRSRWWAMEDLNFRPRHYQCRALTN